MPAKKQTTKSGAKNNVKKVKKQAEKVVETPVVETPVVETPVVESPVVDTPVDTFMNYEDEFKAVSDDLKSAMVLIKGLMTRVNQLEKRVSKDRKVAEKKMKGRAKRVVDPNKPPSGFAKPGPISDELTAFLGIKKGELIARTAVTQHINKYCKEHNLQKESDKRHINADAALSKLLRLKPSDELTFFNLQKYIKIHYPNKEGVFEC